MALVAVDRGHGWGNRYLWVFDPGAVGLVKEADITLVLAILLDIKLRYDGINVFPIRIGGKETARLLWRGIQLANKLQCDRYISIHCNAGGGNGWEIWVRNDDDKSMNLAVNISNNLKKVIENKMNFRGIKQTTELSVCVQTKMPACLIELGFVDSEVDVRLLKEISFLNVCARAIVDGIKKDLKL